MNKSNFNRKGFSLIEVMVVIAIMAVLTAILIPTLIVHIEDTRAKKDNNSMSEVKDAIALALTNEDVYNEVMYYITLSNYSSYIDTKRESENLTNKVTEEDSGYYFNDEARTKDGVVYSAAGLMQGVTITFQPDDNGVVSIGDGVINKFKGNNERKTNQATNIVAPDRVFKTKNPKPGAIYVYPYARSTPQNPGSGLVSNMRCETSSHKLYDSIINNIDSKIELKSQTYKNSEYTVFIKIAEGEKEAYMSDMFKVYGQWNGTHLE